MNSTPAEAKAKDRDLNYWKTRAATAEEKVKEWSVRACEAEERIHNAQEIITDLWVHGRILIADRDRVLDALGIF